MYIFVRNCLRRLFRQVNLGLVKHADLERLKEVFVDHTTLTNKLNFFSSVEPIWNSTKNFSRDVEYLTGSKSQNGQDLFSLIVNNFKKEGIFIEFGAYDGLIYSNTQFLEKHYAWTGVLIDPIPSHFESMKSNRNCSCIHGAITAGGVESILIEELPASDLSKRVDKRELFKRIHRVKSFTLNQVIDSYLPSLEIDFLSIDIEGNELEILKSIDLYRYKINAICVEHNFGEDSREILNYMTERNYRLVYKEFSKNDYWFVRSS